ncbi:MBL fold metallo-hydrolase [Methanoregula sp.]|uniref:MBL fold metallo-hydrolase n=1 Tax=Methanoregula sp. TaxID=2052170 RepID=UPI002C9661E2|nr:MBL fold metallo-hydrolase [Methanoregula sp.]HVP96972.1 MBL fold metallo-hydrolase [Methanoregula sp.]
MRCTILASGSKGNCTCVSGDDGALLIDAGLSAKETFLRLRQSGCDPESVTAIIVTHEHTDHIRGLDVLARKISCPVYGTGGTLADFCGHRRTSDKSLETHACRYDHPFTVAGFTITPFATSHDAAEPCGFILQENGTRLGYCTDTGVVGPHILSLLRGCDGVVLESNHCPDMLANGPYPESLKRRIRSSRGHLSNPAAAAVLQALGRDVPQVVLSHLSEINNTPERARASARDGLGLFFEEKNLIVATQHGWTPGAPQEIRL